MNQPVLFIYRKMKDPVKMPAATAERVKGMVEIRDAVRELIAMQMEEYVTDEEIRTQQEKLNQVYDAYTAKYGVIGNNANKRAFSDDSSYCLLCSLEDLNDDGTLKRKADMFTKRTIKKAVAVRSVETASEALVLSLNEKAKVDLPYMAQLTGKPEEKIKEELRGVIFQNPLTDQWENGDEYLSGNVREKLNTARTFAETYPEFTANMQDHILPYLQSFCSLEEKRVQERREQQVAEKQNHMRNVPRVSAEMKVENTKLVGEVTKTVQPEGKKAIVKSKKPSIHERLEINKKKIQEKQGKDKPERGADRGVRTV